MSQYFQVGDQVVWNPALGVGELYARMAEAIAPLVDVPTGVGPVVADEYQLDLPVFQTFVESLIQRFEKATHSELRGMTGGFIATSVVMLERSGVQVAPLTDDHLIALRAIAGRKMAT